MQQFQRPEAAVVARKVTEDKQARAPAPQVLKWADLTPYQRKIVTEGRKRATPVPATVRSGAEFVDWLRSRRNQSNAE